jgi:Arc/MetJ-type ribon-helix-helix transcriptional regulator
MELIITPEIEDLIARKLATGRYQNAEHIVTEALRRAALVDEQRSAALDALKHMIDDCSVESMAARDWLRQSQSQPDASRF